MPDTFLAIFAKLYVRVTDLVLNNWDEIDARDGAYDGENFRRCPELRYERGISRGHAPNLGGSCAFLPETVGKHGWREEFSTVFENGAWREKGERHGGGDGRYWRVRKMDIREWDDLRRGWIGKVFCGDEEDGGGWR